MMPTMIVAMVILGGAGLFAYLYFTQPQRVYGARTLKCGPTEVSWASDPDVPGAYIIKGCGRETVARCLTDRPCAPFDSAPSHIDEVTF